MKQIRFMLLHLFYTFWNCLSHLHPLRRLKAKQVNTRLKHRLRQGQKLNVGFLYRLILLRHDLRLMVKAVERVGELIDIGADLMRCRLFVSSLHHRIEA